MLGFCYSKKLVPAAWAITDSAATQLHRLLLVQCRRLISSASSSLPAEKPKEQGQSFTVSYLVDKCGLSPEKALSVSQKMTLRTPTNPDSVLSLLRNHGLTETHISGVIRCNPKLLLTNPQKTLLPKLQILASIDVSNDELGRILIRNPSLLTRNLRDGVARHLDFLRAELLLSRAQIVKVMKNSQRFLSRSLEDSIASNIALLRELGMPQSSVSALVTCNPDTVYMHFRMFHGFVRETIANGYNPKESKFLHALVLFSALSKSTRERKMESYRRWGWSEEQIQVTLQAHPQFMYVSEKKFKLVMEFLVNKASWQTADCVRCPSIFNHSLEKRIVPRCSVIVSLLSKGLVKKNTPLGTILCTSEKLFLDRFVTKYQDDVPELLEIYQGKIVLPQLALGPDNVQ